MTKYKMKMVINEKVGGMGGMERGEINVSKGAHYIITHTHIRERAHTLQQGLTSPVYTVSSLAAGALASSALWPSPQRQLRTARRRPRAPWPPPTATACLPRAQGL